MSEDNGAVVAASTEVAEENAGAKEAIYEKVSEFVKAKTGKRIGKSGGQELFNIVVAEIFLQRRAKDPSASMADLARCISRRISRVRGACHRVRAPLSESVRRLAMKRVLWFGH